MQFNLSQPLDAERFKAKVAKALKDGKVVELTEKVFKTPSQNRYLHLLIGVVAMETGNSLEDTKVQYFKKLVNASIFVETRRDKLGNVIESVRSIKDVSREDLSIAIDRFKRWGYDNGIYMPNPGDEALLREIEIELGRNRMYV